jgi:hypothetical protein
MAEKTTRKPRKVKAVATTDKRKKKQAKAPTNRITPFIYFTMEERKAALARGEVPLKGREAFLELGRQNGRKWFALSPEQRTPYIEGATKETESRRRAATSEKKEEETTEGNQVV